MARHKTLRSAQSVLHLNLHREFFAAVAAGTKRVEYRQRTPYWRRRLEGREYDVIQFRNGYATLAPVTRIGHVDLNALTESVQRDIAIVKEMKAQ